MDKYFNKAPTFSIGSTSGSTLQELRQSGSNIDSNFSHEIDGAEQDPPSDPGLRPHLSQYKPNEQDRVRKYYLSKGPFQPSDYNFPKRDINGRMRRFNKEWFGQYNTWLEYSIAKDAAFCLCCYLFRPENVGSGGGTSFVGKGYRNWKSKKGLDNHVGDSHSLHNEAYRRCVNLMNEKQSIQAVLGRESIKEGMDYRIQLTAIVDEVRYILKLGQAFRGHDESKSSTNSGNFLQLLRILGDHNKEINNVILDNAPQNRKLIASTIQRDIANACAEETIKEVIDELGDELFFVMVDEARDISLKDQMAVVIRFVNKKGCVVERFLGIVHVSGTTSLQLKAALDDLFGKYGLTILRLRGQGYNGASNMREEFNGLKTLILQENESAYHVHYYAHQLQLTLIAAIKKYLRVCQFFQKVDGIRNVVTASKKFNELHEGQRIKIVEAISNEDISMGRGLNQEMGLAHSFDTVWTSHYKTLTNFLKLFLATIEVLENVEKDGKDQEKQAEACGFIEDIRTFDFVFMCHLMQKSLGVTYDLSQTLQHTNQDVVNVMCLVKIAKDRLKQLRDSGWTLLFEEVCAFCEKHEIEIPSMEAVHHCTRRIKTDVTNLHHYRVNMFYTVIDMQLQELNERFMETTTELLVCMSCLHPSNSFSAYNIDKLLRLARFYPLDFSEWELSILENQLENYRLDMQSNSDFLEVEGMEELSHKLVEKRKHIVYPLVYKLIKLALILPMTTASVERVISAMSMVKEESRNRMGDQWLNDCLVIYIERDLFKDVDNERIMHRFQKMKIHRCQLDSSSTS